LKSKRCNVFDFKYPSMHLNSFLKIITGNILMTNTANI
jgi:hypothetical protein